MARRLGNGGRPERAATRVLPAALALALSAGAAGTSQDTAPVFPPRLEEYLSRDVRLALDRRKALMAGAPVTELIDVDESVEVGVFGAVWIAAPVRRYVDALHDIERFERGGGFKVTKRISTPPALEDFADLRLPDDAFRDLKKCRVGDCVVKLDEPTILRLRAEVNWKSPEARSAADGVMRRFALEFVNGYLEGGNQRLPVYRDHERPVSAAEEFRAMVDQMPELTKHLPNLRRYLLDFPAVPGPQPESFFYWQETEFGLRPTIRISHVVIWETPEGTAAASRMLYASHYFRTGLELRVLVDDPSRGPGFWFVTISRSRVDGLGGFTGRLIRGRVRDGVRKGSMAALRGTKRRLETPVGG